ncbi:hypothetical protein SNARM312S_04062 [Streptomyces narbonensis]
MSWRETVVMWWAGMRGVASVALALAIPLRTDDGEPFPGRDEIVFIAFCVIIATLVFQGLTLPWLVRKLGVRAPPTRSGPWSEISPSGPRRPPSAGSRRCEEVEELPEEVQERLLRGAYDIGARTVRTWSTRSGGPRSLERTKRFKAVQRIQRELMSAARHEVLGAQRAGRRPGGGGPGAASAGRAHACGEAGEPGDPVRSPAGWQDGTRMDIMLFHSAYGLTPGPVRGAPPSGSGPPGHQVWTTDLVVDRQDGRRHVEEP